jgi:pimeloyl-ACP methyl ester carboxylesterase
MPDSKTILLGAVGGAALLGGGAWAWRRLEQMALQGITRPARSTFRATPADLGLPWEEIAFATSDGVEIRGWFFPATPGSRPASNGRTATPPDPGTIILGHGFSASRHTDLHLPAFLVPAGFNVLMLDFRAHGESGGTQTSAGYLEHQDILAAVAYLQGRGLHRIGVQGYSLGAAVSIVSAALCPALMGVVADSGFARLATPLAQILQGWGRPPWQARFAARLGAWFVARDLHFNADEAAPVHLIGRISPRPIFLIHGDADQLIPVSDARALYAAAGDPKQLWVVPGAVHDGGAYAAVPDEYRRRVIAFWRDVFAAAPVRETPAARST